MKFLSLAVISTLALAVSAAPAKTNTKAKVAILGGGVSGISAAKNLVAAGITDFVIVEARDELGGRAHDIAFAGKRVEKGCNWVQGLGTNPINEMAIKWGLKTVSDNSDNVVFYDNKGPINATDTYNAFWDAYDAANNIAIKRNKTDQVDISVRAALDLSGWMPQTYVEQAIEFYGFDWEFAETPDVSSNFYAYVNADSYDGNFGSDSDGNNFVIDQRGFKYIFLQEANQFLKPNDPRLLLNTTVKNIKYSDSGVVITAKDGSTIQAEYAISTFSLGVLQHNDVTWTPKLPEWKLVGLDGFHMATYLKLFLAWEKPFWDLNTEYVVYADPTTRGYYNSWQNLNGPGFFPQNTTSNIFFVTLTQDQAYRVEAMADADIKEEVMEVIRSMYGKDIPDPSDMYVPRWHSDPLYRGTYSNWPIGELEQHHINMKAPVQRVWFTGEAMSRDYFGFLQGAWIDGGEVGTKVAQCVKSSCPKQPYYPTIKLANETPSFVKRQEWL
ncbi:hypothetical protein K450DRAFT_170824 [Umbelopsis ramanniana AG]|uniref:Amine oxidase n=1 Tax=Umbelopsis ramanniana AG TaxID=1314678 RepID=A0AAD5HFJ3_UMBRA|nr:uncharacterized protein K450DRAFT_170824 [Umbelopsis ramanniana AG]KAI8582497.1 hypothetical protein K450DRAFT_170824 [Umbelopsis ramanniana AG]